MCNIMPQMTEENNTKLATAPAETKTSAFWDLVKYTIIALLIVIPFRMFVAQPYIVSGASSYPTFKDGDYLIVDQLSKRFEEPKRQDFLIIRYPKDQSKFFIKRLIGLPGDQVEIIDGEITIYNEANKDGLRLEEPYVEYKKIEDFSIKLGADQYFVMGDNRAGSSDSRVWGTLPKKNIIGRPIVRLLPLNKIDLWPGVLKSNE